MSHSEPSLPFSGVTPISRHHSWLAAQVAKRGRGPKTERYLQAITDSGDLGLTDHEAHAVMGGPFSSIQSIRNNLCRQGLVGPAAERGLSPYGCFVTRWKRC